MKTYILDPHAFWLSNCIFINVGYIFKNPDRRQKKCFARGGTPSKTIFSILSFSLVSHNLSEINVICRYKPEMLNLNMENGIFLPTLFRWKTPIRAPCSFPWVRLLNFISPPSIYQSEIISFIQPDKYRLCEILDIKSNLTKVCLVWFFGRLFVSPCLVLRKAKFMPAGFKALPIYVFFSLPSPGFHWTRGDNSRAYYKWNAQHKEGKHSKSTNIQWFRSVSLIFIR